jgi:uncharacterized protein (DUF1684 family)
MRRSIPAAHGGRVRPPARVLVRTLLALAAIVPAALAAAAGPSPRPRPAAPVRLSAAAAETLKAAILKDRADTEEWLRGKPTSYLATVLRRDFDERTALTVGRDPASDVRLDDPEIAPHHLRVTVAGDSFHVEALDAGAQFRVQDQPRRDAMLPPSSIAIGRFTMRLSHQRFPALIVFDPRSAGFARYKGLAWFPVDFAYRYELPLTPNPAADTVVIMSTRGNARRALRVGWFDFAVAGRPCRLEADRLLEPGVDEKSVSVFFRDATTGRETYGVGRYVDPEPLPDGRWVLDFNNAYNPACAVSEHYNCPIPRKGNTLAVAIRAGEMDSHYH